MREHESGMAREVREHKKGERAQERQPSMREATEYERGERA